MSLVSCLTGYEIINIHDISLQSPSLTTFFTGHTHVAGKEKIVKEEKIDFNKRDDEKWKRRSLPAGKVQGKINVQGK